MGLQRVRHDWAHTQTYCILYENSKIFLNSENHISEVFIFKIPKVSGLVGQLAQQANVILQKSQSVACQMVQPAQPLLVGTECVLNASKFRTDSRYSSDQLHLLYETSRTSLKAPVLLKARELWTITARKGGDMQSQAKGYTTRWFPVQVWTVPESHCHAEIKFQV